jgi:ubiquinone/menaquinone biosynthesis C-methylase UbiE
MEPPSTTTPPDPESALHEQLLRYYEASSLDYRFWSPGFQMHFGYYRAGLNPLSRERMLQEMNRQVFARLALSHEPQRVADLGCGLGAPARDAARAHSNWQVDALSLVPWQIQYAEKLTREAGIGGNLRFSVGDYTKTTFADETFDGAYAIESSCHATGADKDDFVREAARILKASAHLVIADGFLKREPLPWPLSVLMRVLCKNWAVPRFANLGAFCEALLRHGFDVIEVRDLSYRVAPSALHVPWVTLRFLLQTLFERVSRVRWGHVVASVLSPLVGMARPYFGYQLVVARRRKR